MIEKRSVGLSIFFTVLTCGIYGMYWFVKLTDETNALSGEQETSGGMALLLTIVTCGIYTLFWNYQMGKKMQKAQERAGMSGSDNAIVYLVLAILGLQIVSYAIMQSDINALV